MDKSNFKRLYKNSKNIRDLLKNLLNLRIDRDSKHFGTIVWIGSYGAYMHIETSLLNLIINLIKEYKNDRHLVG